jgi:hypothetical protein
VVVDGWDPMASGSARRAFEHQISGSWRAAGRGREPLDHVGQATHRAATLVLPVQQVDGGHVHGSHDVAGYRTPHTARVCGVPGGGCQVGAPPAVHDVRARRVLRYVTPSACDRALHPDRPPGDPVLRVARGLGVLLPPRRLPPARPAGGPATARAGEAPSGPPRGPVQRRASPLSPSSSPVHQAQRAEQTVVRSSCAARRQTTTLPVMPWGSITNFFAAPRSNSS